MAKPHVIVVGGGFGGLQAVLSLRGAPVDVTLVDRHNHHLFQPLLYQVATGGLSPANISAPLRAVLRRQRNAQVLLGEVHDVDAERREIVLAGGRISYDTLIVATGSQANYFGQDQWATLAPSLKTNEDALGIRNRILFAFEQAERASRASERASEDEAWLTFVIVGGGATGVELAGALGELKGQTLRRDFRRIDPTTARVILVEGADRLLPAYRPGLAQKALRALDRLGVTVRTQTLVKGIEPGTVTLRTPDGAMETIRAQTVVWTAGVHGTLIGRKLAEAVGAEPDRSGRVIVEPDLTVPRHPEILVIGDLAHCAGRDGKPLPALAPVAMQQGRYAARLIRARLRGRTLPPFRYRDRGTMTTVGRGAAVVDLKWTHFNGWFGWLVWLFVHLLYIVQFGNRLLILVQWGWNYFTRNRSARLITEQFAHVSQWKTPEETWAEDPEPAEPTRPK
jgi:NADH dehydrogenase